MTLVAQQDAQHIKQLQKSDIVDFYNQYINPESKERAKVSVFLRAQSGGDELTDIASELGTKLSLDSSAIVDIEKFLVSARGIKNDAIEPIKNYLVEKSKISEKIAMQALGEWTNEIKSVFKVITPLVIKDVRQYKTQLMASQGAYPAKDLSEYEDIEPKL